MHCGGSAAKLQKLDILMSSQWKLSVSPLCIIAGLFLPPLFSAQSRRYCIAASTTVGCAAVPPCPRIVKHRQHYIFHQLKLRTSIRNWSKRQKVSFDLIALRRTVIVECKFDVGYRHGQAELLRSPWFASYDKIWSKSKLEIRSVERGICPIASLQPNCSYRF